MASQFKIKSSVNSLTFEMSAENSDSVLAKVSGAGINAEAFVYTFMSKGIGEFFTNLSSNWKGWQGNIEWSSLEGEIKLQASCDRLGHIFLSVWLTNGAPPIWEAHTELVLEAGQLEMLAAEALAFESVAFNSS